MVELASGVTPHGTEPNTALLDWLDAVAEWKASLQTVPGASAADLVIEDRRARR